MVRSLLKRVKRRVLGTGPSAHSGAVGERPPAVTASSMTID